MVLMTPQQVLSQSLCSLAALHDLAVTALTIEFGSLLASAHAGPACHQQWSSSAGRINFHGCVPLSTLLAGLSSCVLAEKL